jgi:hypothetical protein
MLVVVLAATMDAPVTSNPRRLAVDAGTNTAKAAAASDYAPLASAGGILMPAPGNSSSALALSALDSFASSRAIVARVRSISVTLSAFESAEATGTILPRRLS